MADVGFLFFELVFFFFSFFWYGFWDHIKEGPGGGGEGGEARVVLFTVYKIKSTDRTFHPLL